MSKEKMTITWERTIERPATQEDVDADIAWHAEHPNTSAHHLVLGEEFECEETIELPGKYEVCDRCDGKGTHVNPSIDGHGITGEEWYGPDWDDESREMYMNGGYDVCCHECNGKRVVLVVDESICDKVIFKAYNKAMDDKAKEDYADARMRYWESGGYDY